MKNLISILVIGILAFICLLQPACSSNDENQTSRTDIIAPGFSLSNLNGQKVSLSDFRGKTVLLNFWATTCPPCVADMPVFEEFTKSAATNISFISIDIGEDPNLVKNFIQKNGYTFPVLLDSQYEVAGKYNIRYTPTSIFIDTKGLVRITKVGAFKDKASIEEQIAGILP
jgi:thiol-disulfide isomerase/thioredoxin